MRILVAEDELVSRRLMDTLLNHWWHNLVTCMDAREALSRFRTADAPSLAILGWLMPDIDGINVCREVR